MPATFFSDHSYPFSARTMFSQRSGTGEAPFTSADANATKSQPL